MKRNNPLLDRVRRHANFSTLFRTAQAVPPYVSPATNRVEMAMPVESVGEQDSDTAVSHNIQRAIDTVEASTMPATPAAPIVPPAPTAEQSDWQRLQRIVQAHDQKRTPAPAAPLAAPAAAPAAASPAKETVTPVQPTRQTANPVVQPKTEAEANWQRLQSIYNAHQRKETTAVAPVDSASEAPAAAAPDVSRAVAAAETGPPAAPADAPAAASASAKPRLEEAWPVRRRPGTPSPEPAAAPTHTPQERPIVRIDPTETAAVQTKLDKINPGRATASSVELHLPNRPRPTTAPARVQPKREAAQATTPPPPTVADSGTPATTAETIPTEIGPLPSDMWEILGDTPPTPDKPATPTAVSTSETVESTPVTVSETAVQQAIAAAETSGNISETAVQRAIAAAETSGST
ncbi:MAG: hypothetical protein R3E31_12825 [Chloroflexota bacterium]